MDPDELDNVFTSPAHREVVRTLGRALAGHVRSRRDPLGESPAVQRVLTWAAEGQGEFVAQSSAASAEAPPPEKKRKGKKKA